LPTQSATIPALPDTVAQVPGDAAGATPDLMKFLATVPDPRDPRGIRHPLVAVLAIAACAVAAGEKTFAEIAEWGQAAGPDVLAAFGARICRHSGRREPPSMDTVRRVLADVDPDALDTAVGLLLAVNTTAPAPAAASETSTDLPTGLAGMLFCDGKTVRAAQNNGATTDTHLLSAMTYDGSVVSQVGVSAKTNEITGFQPLLSSLDITGVLISADALHTQVEHVKHLNSRGAYWLLTVKENHPNLYWTLAGLPWSNAPQHVTVGKGHGRIETRAAWVLPAPPGVKFPGTQQAFLIEREVRYTNGKQRTTAVVLGITNMTSTQAGPRQTLHANRSHWRIENGLHWVSDVTFGEDSSRIHAGNAPRTMATLRNLAIGMHRQAKSTNIAKSLREHRRDTTTVLRLFGIHPTQ